MHASLAVVAAAVACAVTLTGCGQDDTTASPAERDPAESPTSTTEQSQQPETTPRDPDDKPQQIAEVLSFTAEQVGGGAFEGAELAGTDTVFWFWAPWCTECAAAAPAVQAAAEASDDVSFVGVAGLSSDVGAMEAFVDQHGLEFTQLADADGSLYTSFGVTQQDTYVLVSADGETETVTGYGSEADPQQLLDEAFG